MKWDWAVDSFKTLITGAVLWGAKLLYEKIKPIYPIVKNLKSYIEKIQKNTGNIAVVKSYQRAFWDVSRDPTFTTNTKGEVDYINPAFSRLLNVSDPRDFMGSNYRRFIHKDDKETMEQEGKRLIDNPGTWEGTVHFVQQYTNKIITTDCRTSPIFDDNNVWQGNFGRHYVISIEDPK